MATRSPIWRHLSGLFPRGDDLSASIAAASIIAKVECDRIMEAADADHPGYGFAQNKGYGGPKDSRHREALARLGPRRSTVVR